MRSLFSIKYHSILVIYWLICHACNRKEIKDTRSWDSGTESHSAADDFFSVTSMLLPFLVLAIHWYILLNGIFYIVYGTPKEIKKRVYGSPDIVSFFKYV